MEPIRTHTYWLSVKEYRKMSKSKNEIKMNNDNIATRTHIFFT